MNQIDLRHGDCMEILKSIPDNSIDLILTDPPYGTVTTLGASKVQTFKDYSWDKKLCTSSMLKECYRVLRPNGKCLLFCCEPYTSELITSQLSPMPFSYKLIWRKNMTGNNLSARKACCNYYEEICLFSKSSNDVEKAHPLRSYFMKELEASGLTVYDFNELVGNYMPSEHYFTNGFQFSIPTESAYIKMQSTGYFKKPYEELKAIDSAYKSMHKSVFNLWEGKKSKSNVLEYSREIISYHPTQKPVLLLEDLIKTYSNPGDLVLDFTMGSGSTGVACVNTDRRFIGIELNDDFYNTAVNRINDALSSKDGV